MDQKTHFCDKVDAVQQFLGRPLLIENPSSYLAFSDSEFYEWDFLVSVQQRTQCSLLLDLNNIYVSACNHGFSPNSYMDAIPGKQLPRSISRDSVNGSSVTAPC
nr:DUF692 family multinuclear iron-containing protein [Dongshaea marina]